MISAIVLYLKGSAAKHALGIAVAVIVVIAGMSWLRDHDARILADATVKASQANVATLEQRIQDVQKEGQAQIAKLQEQRKEVKTPAQALAALPSVSDIPLQPVPLPDDPSKVSVDALPLFQTLNECKQCSSKLATAEATAEAKDAIITEKDVQITALKKKRGFWKTFEHTAEAVGIGVAVGYAAHR